MKIIFVGPDCAGKSSIIQCIKGHKDFGEAFVYEANSRVSDRLDMVQKVIAELKDDTDKVLDRWQYPDDIVYESVCGQKVSPLMMLEKDLARRFNELGNVMIYVTASPAVLTARYKQRGDDEMSLKEILQVDEAYREFFAVSKVNRITIDTTCKTTVDAVEDIVNALWYWRNQTKNN